jgi:hypothetical protein
MAKERPAITGNRLVLAGAVLYLLEWVAIIPAGDSGPSEAGTRGDKVLALYTAHPTAVAFLATWLSVVLVGRVLIVLGIRDALRSIGANDTLPLFAAAAMTLSVAMELVSEALVGAAGVLAAQSGDPDVIRALDAAAGTTWDVVFGLLGVAVAVSAWAMLRSRAFPLWICAIGLVGGVLMMLVGVFAGPARLHEGIARSISTTAQVGVPLFWVWMLATGIFLLRRTPARTAPAT